LIYCNFECFDAIFLHLHFRLPVDIFYQTAKISKLLLMMEQGTVPVEYKGKYLEDINIDLNLEYAEEDRLGKSEHKKN
jgi:hypothetical protein